ncbi:hypothetical protein LDC_1992 [sediment metagenome]|uniref:Uncharacterized protein n=1 Tax=sediment metagenome TaxID=749907 RepID=D9PKC7_9ZZZZ
MYAKTGFQAAITSIGTIQKSSSQGKISHKLFCTRLTSSSPYFAPAKAIFFQVICFSKVSL